MTDRELQDLVVSLTATQIDRPAAEEDRTASTGDRPPAAAGDQRPAASGTGEQAV